MSDPRDGIWKTEGLRSTTFKVEVKSWIADDGRVMDVNAYFHLLWAYDPTIGEERLVGIDFDGMNAQAGLAKAALRELCRELSQRLRHGEVGLGHIVDRWVAQRFEPAGYCPQTSGMIKSILDGAAKVLAKRYKIGGYYNDE